MVKVVNPNESKKEVKEVKHSGGGTSKVIVEKTKKGYTQTIVSPSGRVTQIEGEGKYGTSEARAKTIATGEIEDTSKEQAEKIQESSGGRYEPVYADGKLTGFRDTEKGVSVPLKTFNKYTKQTSAEESRGLVSTKEGVKTTKQVAKENLYRDVSPLPKAPPKSVEPAGFFDYGVGGRIKQSAVNLGESAEYYASFGGKLDYKPTFESSFIPNVPTEGVGTTQFRQPTIPELRPEQRVERRALNYPRLGIDTESIETKYQKEVMIASLPSTFIKSAVAGAVTVVAPPVGATYFGVTGAEAIVKRKQIISQVKAYPKETALQFGTGIAGGVVGGVGVAVAYPKVSGFFRTIGKTKIKPETIVEPQVLSGKKTFPEGKVFSGKVNIDYKKFIKSEYKLPGESKVGVWHASPEKFSKTIKIKPGKARLNEPMGLYTAPSVSTYFFRVGKSNYKLFGIPKESVLKSPTLLRVYPKGIVKWIRGRVGYAEVRGVKPEVEAIIPPGTRLNKLPSKYYTSVKGLRIPIKQYRVSGEGITKTTLAKGLDKYSYSYGRTPVFTPYSLGYGTSYLRSPKSYGYSRSVSGINYPSYYPKYSKGHSKISYSPSYSFKPPKSYSPYKSLTYTPYYPKYPKGGTPTLLPPTYPYLNPPTKPPKKPPYDFSFFGKKTKKSESFKRPFYYQPSLAAMGLNLKSPKIPKGFKSGLVTRYKVPKSVSLIRSKK